MILWGGLDGVHALCRWRDIPGNYLSSLQKNISRVCCLWVQRMFLRNLRSARHASVRECSGVTDERVLALCTAAPQLQTLQVVGGPAVYGQLSAPLPELGVLELIRCGVEDTAAVGRACPRLTTLRLDHCPLSTCQLELAALTDISLVATGLGDAGASALGEACGATLRSFDLWR